MHPVNRVRESVDRLTHAARGQSGTFWLIGHEGDGEYVVIRREDLELLLASWTRERESEHA